MRLECQSNSASSVPVMNNYRGRLWVMHECARGRHRYFSIASVGNLWTERGNLVPPHKRVFPNLLPSEQIRLNINHRSGEPFIKYIHNPNWNCFVSNLFSRTLMTFFNTGDTLRRFCVFGGVAVLRTSIQFKLLSNYQLHRYQEVSFCREKTMIFKPFPFPLLRCSRNGFYCGYKNGNYRCANFIVRIEKRCRRFCFDNIECFILLFCVQRTKKFLNVEMNNIFLLWHTT